MHSIYHRIEGESSTCRIMAGRTSACLIGVVILLVSCVQPVHGVTIVKADPVDIMPISTLTNSSQWNLDATLNDTSPAQYTSIGIDENGLIISHSRPENTATTAAWSTTSSTGSTAATGIPDGGVAISDGPDIKVSGFNHGSTTSNTFLNASLSLILTIPDVLDDDEVRFIVDRGNGPVLLHTIRHTFGPTIYSQSTPLLLSLYDENNPWTWTDISQTEVLVDYVSVNNIDDSELQLDAVAIIAHHRSPWYAFETTTALHTTEALDMPVMDFDYLSGVTEGLTVSSCGLEPSSSNPGNWQISSIERPYNQQWGRLHLTYTGNSSIQIRENGDTTWSTILEGELINIDKDVIDIRVNIVDGCVSNLRIDINDPNLQVSYRIEGDNSGLVSSISTVRFAVGGSLVEEIPIQSSNGSFSVPVGHLLGNDGDSLDIGIGSRFQWSSDGAPEDISIIIESMKIDGAYILEFDQDPQCQNVDDQNFNEDEPGRYIPFRYYCTDDITPISELAISVSSSDSNIISSSVVGDEILLMPQLEMSGSVIVDIIVTDQRGNTWIDQINVNVIEINDAPELTGLPTSAYIEVGTPYTISLDIKDVDSSTLSVTTDHSWATIVKCCEGDQWVLTLAPLNSGQTFVTILIEDEETRFNQTIEVISTSSPDLSIESIDAILGDQTLNEPISIENGELVSFRILVRNSGQIEATSVGVECNVGDASLPGDTIPSISPGGLGTVFCYWSASGNDSITMTANADANNLIDELDETNNQESLTLTIINSQNEFIIKDTNEQKGGSGEILILSIVIVALAGAALLLGPKRIERPHDSPNERLKRR